MARPTGRPVRAEILVASRDLIQRVGVGAFSYNQLAEQLGIKAPSIHHHFKRKEDLVAEVARLYREEFASELASISDEGVLDRVRSYSRLFLKAASNDLTCLCIAIAAEWATTGPHPREQVEGFVDDQIEWLSAQLRLGVESGDVRGDIDSDVMARTILSVLEGSLMLMRVDPTVLVDASLEALLATLKPAVA